MARSDFDSEEKYEVFVEEMKRKGFDDISSEEMDLLEYDDRDEIAEKRYPDLGF